MDCDEKIFKVSFYWSAEWFDVMANEKTANALKWLLGHVSGVRVEIVEVT